MFFTVYKFSKHVPEYESIHNFILWLLKELHCLVRTTSETTPLRKQNDTCLLSMKDRQEEVRIAKICIVRYHNIPFMSESGPSGCFHSLPLTGSHQGAAATACVI